MRHRRHAAAHAGAWTRPSGCRCLRHAARIACAPPVCARRRQRPGSLRMKHRRACRAALAFAALVSCRAGAQAADISILGKWQIVEAVPAPWSPPGRAGRARRRRASAAQYRRDLRAASRSNRSSSRWTARARCSTPRTRSRSTRCSRAICRSPIPPRPPPRLGFPKGDIPGVDVRCLKALLTFHFRDPDTAMINLDRVIYTLKRQ